MDSVIILSSAPGSRTSCSERRGLSICSLEWTEVATVHAEKRVLTLAGVGITGYYVRTNGQNSGIFIECIQARLAFPCILRGLERIWKSANTA